VLKRRIAVLALIGVTIVAVAGFLVWRQPTTQNAILSRLDVSALSQRVASDPTSSRAQYWYGKRLAEAGNLPQAEAALRTSLGLQPDDLVALGELGKVLFAETKTEEAFQVLRMTVGRDPNAVEPRTMLAALYQAQGATQRAMDELNVVLKQDAHNVSALYQLGACQATVQQYGNAEATFRLALHEAPNDVRTLVGMSRVLRAMRRLEEAEAMARKAIQLDPENVDGLTALAQVLAMSRPLDKNRDEALGLLRHARAIDANRIDIPRTAAEILTAAGRWREAVSELREVIRIAPDSTQAYFLLARAYRQLGQLVESQRAEAIFRTCSAYDHRVNALRDQIAADMDSAQLRFALAEVHAKAGFPERAIVALRSGLERDPKNVQAQKRLAAILKQVSQP